MMKSLQPASYVDCENAVLDSLITIRQYIESCYTNDSVKEMFSQVLHEYMQQTGARVGLRPWVLICVAILYVFMICVGFAGNILVIFVVLYNRVMRSSPRNLFILNLAVSDLILCIITQPLNLYRLLSFSQGWQLGQFMCKVSSMVQGTNVFVSSMSITAIALDRFRLIMNPSRRDIRVKTVYLILVLLWCLAFTISTPLGVFATVSQHSGREICSEVTLNYKLRVTKLIYSILMMLLLYGTPVILVSIAYAQICFLVHRRIQAKQRNHVIWPDISATHKPSDQSFFERADRQYSASSLKTVGDPIRKQMHLLEPSEDAALSSFYLKRTTNQVAEQNANHSADLPKRSKVTCIPRRSHRTRVLLASVAVLFACSWLPINIVNLLLDLRELKFQVLSINYTSESPIDTELWWGSANNAYVTAKPTQQITAPGVIFQTLPHPSSSPSLSSATSPTRGVREDNWNLSGETVMTIQAFCLLCVLVSACINPMLYGWLNENFRRNFRHILRCNSRAGSAETNSSVSQSRRREPNAHWPRSTKRKMKAHKPSTVSLPVPQTGRLDCSFGTLTYDRYDDLDVARKTERSLSDCVPAMKNSKTDQQVNRSRNGGHILQETDIDAL